MTQDANADEVRRTRSCPILCTVCGRGPAREDGGVCLFSIASPTNSNGLARFCGEDLPLDELQRRLERHWRGERLLDPETTAIFKRRSIEAGADQRKELSTRGASK
jgi:hypothetical protein